MHGVRTRRITVEDAGEVLTLQRAAYATEAQIYGDPFLPALTQTLSELEDELRVGSGAVALSGERIIAAVRWTVTDATVHIGRLAVAPDQQGRGLGTTLLRLAEHESTAAKAELFTGHLSTANIRLYVREGYVETRREALHDGVDLVYLAKRLSERGGGLDGDGPDSTATADAQRWPAPTDEPAMGRAAPEAKPLMAMRPTMIQRVFRMPIWWLIQPSTGGPHRNAT